MKNKVKVSIITVCLNSENFIERTIKSVLNQNYNNLEYIIIDGKSTDKTIDIIRKYEIQFNGKMIWLSEKDEGIYDAMNKGLQISTGDYLFFLNAGDFFLKKDIISRVVKRALNKNADFIYGPVKIGKNKIRNNRINSEFNLIFQTICHQGIFAHRKCFVNNNFNKKYIWLADYQWVVKCFQNKGIKKIYTDNLISYFDPSNNTGLDSYALKMRRLKERFEIGINSFRGIYKLIFLINQFRLSTKYKYFYKNNTFKN